MVGGFRLLSPQKWAQRMRFSLTLINLTTNPSTINVRQSQQSLTQTLGLGSEEQQHISLVWLLDPNMLVTLGFDTSVGWSWVCLILEASWEGKIFSHNYKLNHQLLPQLIWDNPNTNFLFIVIVVTRRDKNTKFFHLMAYTRRRENYIDKLSIQGCIW